MINLSSYKNIVMNEPNHLEKLFQTGYNPNSFNSFACDYAKNTENLELILLCNKYGATMDTYEYIPKNIIEEPIKFINFLNKNNIKINRSQFFTKKMKHLINEISLFKSKKNSILYSNLIKALLKSTYYDNENYTDYEYYATLILNRYIMDMVKTRNFCTLKDIDLIFFDLKENGILKRGDILDILSSNLLNLKEKKKLLEYFNLQNFRIKESYLHVDTETSSVEISKKEVYFFLREIQDISSKHPELLKILKQEGIIIPKIRFQIEDCIRNLEIDEAIKIIKNNLEECPKYYFLDFIIKDVFETEENAKDLTKLFLFLLEQDLFSIKSCSKLIEENINNKNTISILEALNMYMGKEKAFEFLIKEFSFIQFKRIFQIHYKKFYNYIELGKLSIKYNLIESFNSILNIYVLGDYDNENIILEFAIYSLKQKNTNIFNILYPILKDSFIYQLNKERIINLVKVNNLEIIDTIY